MWGAGKGGSFSWIFFPFIQKKKKKRKPFLFSWPRIPFLTAGVERAAAPVGWGLLWPHTRGTAAAARSQKCLMPQGPLAQLQLPVGLGPGGPTCRLLGAVRPGRSLRGLREAWEPSPPSRQAAHITSLDPQFLCSGGWQIYCTSDSGTWQGLAGAGEGGGRAPGRQGPGASFLWPECWDIRFS